jgi:hypothetical protein
MARSLWLGTWAPNSGQDEARILTKVSMFVRRDIRHFGGRSFSASCEGPRSEGTPFPQIVRFPNGNLANEIVPLRMVSNFGSPVSAASRTEGLFAGSAGSTTRAEKNWVRFALDGCPAWVLRDDFRTFTPTSIRRALSDWSFAGTAWPGIHPRPWAGRTPAGALPTRPTVTGSGRWRRRRLPRLRRR